MTDSASTTNKFEFVILAGARARQLLRGCTPKAEGSHKPARLATLEIKQGHISKVPVPVED